MIVQETYVDRVKIVDEDNVPGAASVTGVVTQPNGTTATPTIITPEVGTYDIDFPTTQVGRHELLITATGGVLGSIVRTMPRVFYVDPAAIPWLISLRDAKLYLNIPLEKTTNDEELMHFIAVASDFVESRTQSWHTQTITAERHTMRRPENVLILRKGPVTAVTSVSENSVVLSSANYELNAVGNFILRTTGTWSGPVDVTYTIGSSVMPKRVEHAVRVVLKHLWTTQRGALPPARQGADEVYDPRSTYSFPRAVAEMLTDLGGAASLFVG